MLKLHDSAGAGGGHALVIGGSLAGLLAARVLREHFESVTIVERDRLPEGPEPRKGVPQSRHVHVLMRRGQLILEGLFPGLCDEMVASGAHVVDTASEMAWLTRFGWAHRFPSDLTVLTFTRDLLDAAVRRRVRATPGVAFIEEADVRRLLPDAGGRGVSGAEVQSRAGVIEGSRTIKADLVVDASGRGSRAPRWLAELGYGAPPETVVNSHVGYASRFFSRTASPGGPKAVFIQAAPPERGRAAVLFPVEGDRWLLTIMGGGGDYAPGDEEGFNEFARSLPGRIVYDIVSQSEPLSPVVTYRATENRLRHFERLRRMPDNFVVTGDAACAFNPVYGQGMTVAALGAEALADELRARRDGRDAPDLTGFACRFQRRLARVASGPWMLATGEDYRYPGTEGGSPGLKTRLMHRYMDEVMRLTTEAGPVRRVLLEVFHMLRPATALFAPRVLVRVVRKALTRRPPRDESATGAPLAGPTHARAN